MVVLSWTSCAGDMPFRKRNFAADPAEAQSTAARTTQMKPRWTLPAPDDFMDG